MSLKTDYKDAIPPSTGRVYRPTYNSDGTMTLEDVTEYDQTGDAFGAADINATNTKANTLDTEKLNAKTVRAGMATLVYYNNYELRATVTFAAPMADTNYAVVATSQDNYAGGGGQNGMSILAKTVNGFVVQQSDGRGLYTSGSVQHAAWIAIPYSNN